MPPHRRHQLAGEEQRRDHRDDRQQHRDVLRQHIAEPHQAAVLAARDHELAEVVLGIEADFGAQREFALRRLEPAGRQQHVLAPQRILDVADRQAARRERCAQRGAVGTGWGWPQGASRLARCLLTLPTHAYLKEEDMARITDAFQAAAAWAAQPV